MDLSTMMFFACRLADDHYGGPPVDAGVLGHIEGLARVGLDGLGLDHASRSGWSEVGGFHLDVRG